LKVEPLVADAVVDCFAADPLAALALALALAEAACLLTQVAVPLEIVKFPE